jgi:putative GTP pyrophosphokinase
VKRETSTAEKLAAEYRLKEPMYKRLAAEVEFGLDAIAKQAGIKTHSVTSRVKTIESLSRKAQAKELEDPLAELQDLVGARVVVLFLSDLPRLDEIIRQAFDVHSSDDKIASGDPSSFGYMSVHYQASLGSQHQGPRYDGLEGQSFEIQARTVVMDAWANVSHYLDYKGASSVPEDLRRDFFALSGLFYVADQHFEMFADRSGQSQEEAKREVKAPSTDAIEVNLDTIEAFLLERFPDRRHASRSQIAEFVEEITGVGYENVRAVEKKIESAQGNFDAYEQRRVEEKEGSRFNDLGVARISLGLVDKNYFDSIYSGDSMKGFRDWD